MSVTINDILAMDGDHETCPTCGAEVVEYEFDEFGKDGCYFPCGHLIALGPVGSSEVSDGR